MDTLCLSTSPCANCGAPRALGAAQAGMPALSLSRQALSTSALGFLALILVGESVQHLAHTNLQGGENYSPHSKLKLNRRTFILHLLHCPFFFLYRRSSSVHSESLGKPIFFHFRHSWVTQELCNAPAASPALLLKFPLSCIEGNQIMRQWKQLEGCCKAALSG